MVRQPPLNPLLFVCFPHASGDGPFNRNPNAWLDWFSPREWGWSEHAVLQHGSQRVFPTRVGMVRSPLTLFSPSMSFPHASGDGPDANSDYGTSGQFSPREWGWSAREVLPASPVNVFPTRVGVVRKHKRPK